MYVYMLYLYVFDFFLLSISLVFHYECRSFWLRIYGLVQLLTKKQSTDFDGILRDTHLLDWTTFPVDTPVF